MSIFVYGWLGVIAVSETFISVQKRSKSLRRVKGRDRYSLGLIWLVVSASIGLGVYVHEVSREPAEMGLFFVLGMTVMIAGSFIRWISITQLKDQFTVDVSIMQGHSLKTDGMYKVIRHPSYTGLLMNLMGAGIALSNLWSILLLTLPFLAIISYRIQLEESLLSQEFTEYSAYKSRTKRLIPYIY